mmetsp:Transcript_13477/g.43991  ORF Transcript_13477/g.43991 Transcript_13477/m.43991 type:complete len:269 (+) Transcript_13477:729-1535(+)|eukprot:scaffold28968_cov120-Isochrysis_galbana.AAC.1
MVGVKNMWRMGREAAASQVELRQPRWVPADGARAAFEAVGLQMPPVCSPFIQRCSGQLSCPFAPGEQRSQLLPLRLLNSLLHIRLLVLLYALPDPLLRLFPVVLTKLLRRSRGGTAPRILHLSRGSLKRLLRQLAVQLVDVPAQQVPLAHRLLQRELQDASARGRRVFAAVCRQALVHRVDVRDEGVALLADCFEFLPHPHHLDRQLIARIGCLAPPHGRATGGAGRGNTESELFPREIKTRRAEQWRPAPQSPGGTGGGRPASVKAR